MTFQKGCMNDPNNSIDKIQKWLIYRNPFKNDIHLSSIDPSENVNYRIYSASGIMLIDKTDNLIDCKT